MALNRDHEHCFLKSPVGWLKISADLEGVTSIEFLKRAPATDIKTVNIPHLKDAYRQLNEYFKGDRLSFSLQLNPRGTDFQKSVWTGLSKIPFGKTVSYKELAKTVGCPKGARAVGMANNKNPLPIVVPCHRVLGHDGAMVGYAPGVSIKERLLELEGVELA